VRLRPVPDQVVVVMGASSGIGRATALAFARRGARVVVAARTSSALDSLVEEIRNDGGTATTVVADVSRVDQVRAVADHAVHEHGRLDTWVHVAGVLLVAPFEDTTPEEFARVLEVNLLGQVYGAKAALPHLKAHGGAFVSVSSMGARRAVPLQSAYIASKHGVDGFVETLRMELQHERAPVSVTEILPATVNTPLFDKARTKIGTKPVAPPPVYPPHAVVEAILHAAEHPVREVVVGGSAKALLTTEALAPRLLDLLGRTVGHRVHRTDEPKPETAPDNLFTPVEDMACVDGSVGTHTRGSAYTWLALRPRLRRALLAGATLGLASWAGRRR
jgi:NAD(P)-dependent dehydrogenase (short-subunit alcohol dehydrogenase family)